MGAITVKNIMAQSNTPFIQPIHSYLPNKKTRIKSIFLVTYNYVL